MPNHRKSALPPAPSAAFFSRANKDGSSIRKRVIALLWSLAFPADRWWNLCVCVDAGGQFRPIGKDAQYLVSIDGPHS